MNIDIFSFGFIVFTFSQFFIALLLLIRYWKESLQVRLTVISLICVCGYVLKQALTVDMVFSPLWWLSFILANILLGSFWLLSITLMGSQQIIKAKHIIIAAVPLILPLTGEVIHAISSVDIRRSEHWVWLFKYVAITIELGFISHVLYLAVGHWHSDLIELRRKWRIGVVSICATGIIFVIISQEMFEIDHLWVKHVELIGFSLLAIIFNFITLSLKDVNVFQFDKETEDTEKKTEGVEVFNQKHIDNIIKAMKDDKLYRQEGFTITDLSKHILLQEYKVRKIINTKLNYRNFNDFLNYYRINEAVEKLSSPEFIGVPVISIAMECGFKAISSFNKSFKETHGVTPSAYRKQVTTPKN